MARDCPSSCRSGAIEHLVLFKLKTLDWAGKPQQGSSHQPTQLAGGLARVDDATSLASLCSRCARKPREQEVQGRRWLATPANWASFQAPWRRSKREAQNLLKQD